MKVIRNDQNKRQQGWRIACIGLLFVGLSCSIALFLSPFSPLHAAAVPAWSGDFVAYKKGDVVYYKGNDYTCIQAHTSEPGWDPADIAALWTLSGNTPGPEPSPTPTGNNQPTPTPVGTPGAGLIPVSATFYSDEGLMADGQETHLGACAVWTKQFPLGTMIKLYDPSNLNQAAYTCTAEDTGTHICNNDIDVSLPGQTALAIQLGVKSMELQVVGFDQVVAQEAADNHPSSPGCSLGPTH